MIGGLSEYVFNTALDFVPKLFDNLEAFRTPGR
jgi:hypothetical protein